MSGISVADLEKISKFVDNYMLPKIYDRIDNVVKSQDITNDNIEKTMSAIIKNQNDISDTKKDVDNINKCLENMEERRKENKTSLFAILALVFTFIFGFINLVITYYKIPKGG